MAAVAPSEGPTTMIDPDLDGDGPSTRTAKRQERSAHSSPGPSEDVAAISSSRPSDIDPSTLSTTSVKLAAPESIVKIDGKSRNLVSNDLNDQEMSTELPAKEHRQSQPVDSIEVGKSPSNAEPLEPSDEDATPQSAAKKRAKLVKSSKKPVPPRKSRSKFDNPLEMLTNQRSPLGTAMLRDLLCDPRAWNVLSVEEREKVLKEFPNQSEILDWGTPNARPNIDLLRSNNNFRHDISRYQEDLREGRHDPEWITQAQAAHRKRELGVYDEFLAIKFLEEWGVAMHDAEGTTPSQEPPEGGSPSNKDANNNENHRADSSGMKTLPAGAVHVRDEGAEPSRDVTGNSSPSVAVGNGHGEQTREEIVDRGAIAVTNVLVGDEKDSVAEEDR